MRKQIYRLACFVHKPTKCKKAKLQRHFCRTNKQSWRKGMIIGSSPLTTTLAGRKDASVGPTIYKSSKTNFNQTSNQEALIQMADFSVPVKSPRLLPKTSTRNSNQLERRKQDEVLFILFSLFILFIQRV